MMGPMTTFTLLVIGALVTARLTRLITRDALTETPRNWAVTKAPDWLAYLLLCDWCASVYVGTAVAAGGAALDYWPWYLVVPIGLASSHVTGWLAAKEND